MKKQIVLWGKDENEKNILIAMKLRVEDRKVDLWTFPKDEVSEEFVESMFKDWEEIDTSTFPECKTYLEQEISNSELLPENIKTTQTDLVIRAEKEWYFQVLAYQMFEQLRSDVTAFGEQVKNMTEFQQVIWDEAKVYSEKIKQHAQERTLMRPQITELRNKLDEGFGILKKLLADSKEGNEEESNQNFEAVLNKLNEFKSQIEKNPNFKEVFEQLKDFQVGVKDIRLKMRQRKDVWSVFNETFDLLKSKRKSNNLGRLQSRIEGLEKAINRMQFSVNRDNKEFEFQEKRKENSGSKLEMQLREAKIQMLKTTIDSKQTKLDDMLQTMKKLKAELSKIETQMNKLSSQADAAIAEEKANNELDKEKMEDKEEAVEAATSEVVDLSNEPVSVEVKEEDIADQLIDKKDEIKDEDTEISADEAKDESQEAGEGQEEKKA